MKDGGSFHKHKHSTLILIIFTFFCFLFLGSKAQALVYCVGCSGATAATCTGGAACGAPCNTGTNGVVCPTIAAALDCIDANNDINATIRIAQAVAAYTGPGSVEVINNTAGAPQVINILGGFTASTCATQTLNPTNTTVQAPAMDRVFLIDNTTSNLLTVTLEGLTITGGNPDMEDCSIITTNPDGGGVCATSSVGSGGLNFTSMSNIYDENSAISGGGLAIEPSSGGNINATIMDDTFTNNSASLVGGGMFLEASGSATLDATIHNTTIGINNPSDPPLFGGNMASQGGGIGISGVGGTIEVSNQGNTITNNTTFIGVPAIGGAGISITNISPTEPVTVSLEEDVITLNEAGGEQGGGISIFPSSGATVNTSISKTKIGNNIADTFGGGIALSGAGIINLFPVVNNIIFKNLAIGNPGGGGVAAMTNGTNAIFDIRFVNNTIANNEATNPGADGGAILADNLGDGRIDWTLPNDIIFFNTAAGDGDQIALVDDGASCTPPSPADCATLAVRFSDIITTDPANIVGTGLGVGFVNLLGGIISSNPLFVNSVTTTITSPLHL